MADEKSIEINNKYNWASILRLAGTDLLDHYSEVLRNLRDEPGILGDIFTQAMPRFTNPVNLKKVINMIDEVDWSSMDVDVKGAAFEGLLEKSAAEGKKGAGQYFTPREHFLCVSINGANEVMNIRVVTIGLVNKSQVHPREVFAEVIAERASAVIIAHNHPNGELKPSNEDIAVTKTIKEAASVLGIGLLDHIIFNSTGYYSFVENNEL
ncbi:MAG: JAB domain-containing protein [Syntrophales bacterium]